MRLLSILISLHGTCQKVRGFLRQNCIKMDGKLSSNHFITISFTKVTTMKEMFNNAANFNINLCAWGPQVKARSPLPGVSQMFNSARSCPNTANPNLAATLLARSATIAIKRCKDAIVLTLAVPSMKNQSTVSLTTNISNNQESRKKTLQYQSIKRPRIEEEP